MRQIEDVCNFMNVGMQIRFNPVVDIPEPMGWINYKENNIEAKLAVTETVSFSREEKTVISPPYMLQGTL